MSEIKPEVKYVISKDLSPDADETKVISRITHTGIATDKSLPSFINQVTYNTNMTLGWLPPGVRYIASGMTGNSQTRSNHELFEDLYKEEVLYHRDKGRRIYLHQAVVVLPPQVNRLQVSVHEKGDTDIHHCAQPFRVLILYILGSPDQDDPRVRSYNMYRARLFYSPKNIYSMDDPLYHSNLRNIATGVKSYSETATGWVCFYNKADRFATLGDAISNGIDRCSGSETFNKNMPLVDGEHIYKIHKREHEELYIIDKWEEKTQKDGLRWVVDPDLWIPVRLPEIDHPDVNTKSMYQSVVSFNNKHPVLTIRRALFEPHAIDYLGTRGDIVHPEFHENAEIDGTEIIHKAFSNAVAHKA